MRIGTYKHKLRSPLSVAGVGGADPIEVGLLTGKASSPYVTITGGALTANEMLRIQAILDLTEGHLWFNLLDMTVRYKLAKLLR